MGFSLVSITIGKTSCGDWYFSFQQVKGAHVEEIELDRENGELVYEVELEGTHDEDAEV
ncbi:PepSY domain-containing protein [Fredinandcohnia sp. QZ13]|uniref:PepSY domain-containing protein n=1 Tax=Fredinandcohnia sp. QZ13 TaxID=3073144 RepID=UPI0037C0A1FF